MYKRQLQFRHLVAHDLHERADRLPIERETTAGGGEQLRHCLLYTSDAADERSSVDLGGRRIIKKTQTQSTLVR